MSHKQNAAVDEPEDTPDHERPPSDEAGEDADLVDRTTPAPYAENFDEWVADETAEYDRQ